MERHPYFDLWLHSDAELEAVLHAPLLERTTLHDWPLSCVQRLDLADGNRWIYKAQLNEGVEAAFYARVRSPLLPAHRDLGLFGNTQSLLLEWIDAPLLGDLGLDESGLLEHAGRLEQAIDLLEAGAPVYIDLGSAPKWAEFAAGVLRKLDRLVASGQFQEVKPACLNSLQAWAQRGETLGCIQASPTLAHADLTGGNIFILPQGYKVIDWQYPRRLPLGFDRATLLIAAGLDPCQYLPRPLVELVWFVRLAWFVECKTRLFPAGETYGLSASELAECILGG